MISGGGGHTFALVSDCASPSPMCIGRADYPSIVTRVLAAGTYELQAFTSPGLRLIVEPPAAAPTNTTCETAIPMTTRVATSIGPRVTDARSRFMRWRSGPTNRAYLQPFSDANNAQATFTLRAGCAAGAPVQWQYEAPYLTRFNVPPGLEVPVVANTDYVLEVSASIGVTLDLTFTDM